MVQSKQLFKSPFKFNRKTNPSSLLFTRAGSCFRSGGFLAYQNWQPREDKRPARIVDYVHLAGVQARLKLGQGHVKLKDRRLALRRVELPRLDQWGLKGLHFPVDELDD